MHDSLNENDLIMNNPLNVFISLVIIGFLKKFNLLTKLWNSQGIKITNHIQN